MGSQQLNSGHSSATTDKQLAMNSSPDFKNGKKSTHVAHYITGGGDFRWIGRSCKNPLHGHGAEHCALEGSFGSQENHRGPERLKGSRNADTERISEEVKVT